MRDVLLEGFTDNLIDFVHSQLYADLMAFEAVEGGSICLNISDTDICINGSFFGFPIPDIPLLGYFPKYNWSNDEDYVGTTQFSNKSLLGSRYRKRES